jgi:hypothetical protein
LAKLFDKTFFDGKVYGTEKIPQRRKTGLWRVYFINGLPFAMVHKEPKLKNNISGSYTYQNLIFLWMVMG